MVIPEIKVPISILPYLWIHYNVFLDANFTTGFTAYDLFAKYTISIRSVSEILDADRSVREIRIVCGKRMNNTYKVIYKDHCYDEAVWLDAEQIPPDLLDQYQLFCEYATDPTYK
jgi:hypothetical protein